MQPTTEQHEVIETPEEAVLVSAFAGTGKTATLRMFAEARPQYRILYLAFNRAIAKEANDKFRDLQNVEARTIHSLAFKHIGYAYKSRLGNIRPYELQKKGVVSNYKDARFVLSALQSYCGSSAESFADLPLRTSSKARIVKQLVTLWNMILDGSSGLPLPHDVYLKLFQLEGYRLDYDYILVDEAQDLTDCVIDIVWQQRAAKVFVGDSHQQIYSWRGAVDSLQKLSGEAQHLFLTQSFRCPEYAANIANRYLRLLDAPKDFHGLESPEVTNSQQAYIARTNAYIFDQATKLDLTTKRVHFLGGFDSYNFRSIVDARKLLDGKPREVQDPFMKNFSSAQAFMQYVDEANEADLKARLEIAKERPDAEEVYHYLRDNCVERQSAADIILTTAHKVKGQEFCGVTILDDFFDVNAAVKKAQSKKDTTKIRAEELNLLYVAITRTLRDLHVSPEFVVPEETISKFRQLVARGKIELY